MKYRSKLVAKRFVQVLKEGQIAHGHSKNRRPPYRLVHLVDDVDGDITSRR